VQNERQFNAQNIQLQVTPTEQGPNRPPSDFFKTLIEHFKTSHLKEISNISAQFLIFVNYGTFCEQSLVKN